MKEPPDDISLKLVMGQLKKSLIGSIGSNDHMHLDDDEMKCQNDYACTMEGILTLDELG